MLVIAGALEGFVSPSGIAYPARIAILAASVSLWIGYFVLAGRTSPKRIEDLPAPTPTVKV